MSRLTSFILITLFVCHADAQASSLDFVVYYVSVGVSWYEMPQLKISGANTSARLVSEALNELNAAYGIVLKSRQKNYVSRADIYKGISDVLARIKKDVPETPLFVFYFVGHGVSEGIGWNHFSLPGTFKDRSDEVANDIEWLHSQAIHAGTLVGHLNGAAVPYLLLFDNCYEGDEEKFNSPVLSETATKNLVGISNILRFINEFHGKNPVLFAAARGEKVKTVPPPFETNPIYNIGPLARRLLISLEPYARGERFTLQQLVASLKDGGLDEHTRPAITKAEIEHLDPTKLVVTEAREISITRLGTNASQTMIDATVALDNQNSPTVVDLEAIGNYRLEGPSGEYISGGRVVGASSVPICVQQFGPGDIYVELEDGDWSFGFATGDGAPFTAMRYPASMRYAFRDEGVPGLEVSGESRGCNEVSGAFQVKAVSYGTNGWLSRFDVSFEQYCDNDRLAAEGALSLRVRGRSDKLSVQ